MDGSHTQPLGPQALKLASAGNPDVSNTAARYVAKAMAKVHPRQRAELLAAMIDHAQDGLSVMGRN